MGGRGIEVCSNWKIFSNFFEDMGVRPDKTTLERVCNDGNYEKDNCRWATQSEQLFNRRTLDSNTSGRTGVCWNKNAGKWMVEIGVDGKSIYLGLHSEFDDAVKCREFAELKYYGVNKT